MHNIASALGLKYLALFIGGTLLAGGIVSTAAQLYVTQYQSSAGGQSPIVQAALNIVIHMTMGPDPNQGGAVTFTHYNPNDGVPSPYPGFDQQKLLQYWSGENLSDIQCAGFVAGALDISGYPMNGSLGAAIDYWDSPGGAFPASSWQYVLPLSGGTRPATGIQPIRGTPQPGDLVVFQSSSPYGHVAIVVAANMPANGGDGTMVLAQANFPPNYYTLDPGKSTWTGADPVPWITTPDIPLYVASLPASGAVDVPGHTLQGYIRNLDAQKATAQLANYAPAPGNLPAVNDTGSSMKLPNSPWVQVAENDARASGIDPLLFARQINQESGFNPNVGNSSAGAIGIAQFEPGTALDWGVSDPRDPTQALAGAARMMASYYSHYLHLQPPPTPDEAYAMALAGYNAGQGSIDHLVATYGNVDWINYLVPETRNYIRNIMGM